MATYYQDPFGAPDYSAGDMPSLLSLSNLESLTRGSVAGLLGLPGEVQRLLLDKKYQPNLPSTEQLLATTPRMTAPTPQAGLLEDIGGFMSPVPAAAVKPAVKVVGRAIKATEGLPVGMSIKDVGKSSITREGNPIQGAVVLVGDKIFMGKTHGDALNRAVYEGIVRKEGGKYTFPKGVEVNSDLFMTKDGQIIDRLQASKLFDIGASETAIEKGLMQNNPSKSMTVDSYIEQATALKKQREKAPYPQQVALDLAQQRAALPVSEGGLGLPANNTAMDRAKAMGFDVDFAHGSPQSNITRFEPSKTGEMGSGIYATNYFPEADIYAGKEIGATIYPLKVKTNTAYQAGEENPYMKLIVSDDEQLQKALQRMGKESIIKTQQPPPDWLKALGTMDMPIREHFVSMNPDLFRSRFAAFDPFRKDVATATAMGVALPDLLAAEPTPQNQSSGLLYPYP